MNGKLCRFVHCRIGSLEIANGCANIGNQVHCRIGSLETFAG
ncbi:hypothetical protein PROSTU_02042 [Providencia stuartii ATCC 25827]|uniref:Uncharacterized protein n=1 Tax=Providencia stuartii ATCC 25827 TaxID=471874 RepID=A0AA87CQG3_PROST|nr:hypothetical protein PROSTU_02042 [Providencia stuartii ATCC 25827]